MPTAYLADAVAWLQCPDRTRPVTATCNDHEVGDGGLAEGAWTSLGLAGSATSGRPVFQATTDAAWKMSV
ncbi:hypothetical protein EV643_1872, partial [Kribbella sp. VKM Ac-2527]